MERKPESQAIWEEQERARAHILRETGVLIPYPFPWRAILRGVWEVGLVLVAAALVTLVMYQL